MIAAAPALLAAVFAAAMVFAPTAAQAAGFGVTEPHFQIGTCNVVECMYEAVDSELSEHGSETLAYTQAAGHPPYGVVGFEFNSEEVSFGPFGAFGSAKKPRGAVRDLRVDIPPGLAANPQPTVVPQCSVTQFDANECGSSEQAGEDELEVYVEVFGVGHVLTLPAPVYNLTPPTPTPGKPGLPLDFGIHVNLSEDLSKIPGSGFAGVADLHILLEGHVSWFREPPAQAAGVASGDYHEWFQIENIPDETDGIPVAILKSKLIFFGNRSGSGFLTLPSECSKHVGGHLFVESSAGEKSETFTTTPVGVEGCGTTPFAPTVQVQPSAATELGSAESDAPDGTTAEVKVRQNEAASERDSADPQQIRLTLPQGMSLNPSAAEGLQACSNAQFGIAAEGAALPTAPAVVEGVEENGASSAVPITCPEGSKLGTLAIETPGLPAGALQGDVYLGQPLSSSPESGVEYRLLLSAESSQYGVGARLVGNVSANATTGRLTATIQAPQLPFSDAILRLRGGPQAPVANPLACTATSAEGALIAYGGEEGGKFYPALAEPTWPFQALGCGQPLPFSLSQSSTDEPSQAGANAAFTLTFSREDGQQYPSELSTTLPEGLLASIASVPVVCAEAQAEAGTCPQASQVGTVRAAIGAGTQPLEVPGPSEAPGGVYLTGGYDSAPFGLVVELPAEHIGPYDFGTVVARATLALDPHTTRATAAVVQSYVVANGQALQQPTALPTIVGGVPVRLRTLSVSFNRLGFALNPTSCATLYTQSQLGGISTLPSAPGAQATDVLSSPFTASGCGRLAFDPGLSASTSAHTSRADGASLTVDVTPSEHQANIKELSVTLPMALVSRDSTLTKACTQAQFAANPAGCPPESRVARAALQTPLLPDPLTGSGYLVSQGGAAFPDLWFILEGDGVTLIEEGRTKIKDGVTTSTFPELPDAPFSSFSASFPVGPYSLLSANGNLCTRTITKRKREVVRKHGHPERKHGRRVYRTRTVSHTVPRRLTMGTTLVAQDGTEVVRSTTVTVTGCAGPTKSKRLTAHLRLRGHTAMVTVSAPAAGKVTVRGRDVEPVTVSVPAGRTITIRAALSPAGLRSLTRLGRRSIALKVTFHGTRSSAYGGATTATVALRI